MLRISKWLLACLSPCLMLGACGLKGGLYLPDKSSTPVVITPASSSSSSSSSSSQAVP